jgi:DNA-binding LacI/PurR family transcriptional regulator
MPSIRDIAKAAGVSLTTVSRVINNKDGTVSISDKTRRRVQQVIKDLDYKPNYAAQRMRSKELERSIGLYVPWGWGWEIGGISSFSAKVTESVSKYIKDLHYSTALIFYSRGTIQKHYLELSEVYGHRIEGMIIMGAHRDDLSFLDSVYASTHPPFVVLHREPEKANFVTADNETGAEKLVSHLIERGHERIALITTPAVRRDGTPNYVYNARYRGYIKSLQSHSLPVNEDLVVQTENLDYPSLSECIKGLLPRKPTAILAARDVMTLAVYKTLKSLDIRVPEDVAVAGFSESAEIGEFLYPSLTRAIVNVEKMGHLAIKQLMNTITGKMDFSPLREVMPCDFIFTESTR